uniref:Uncharacterized protein n=1 Tax=Macrostomum lignano TaxID=282301 RepID=A0A1I8JQK2_9PLAT
MSGPLRLTAQQQQQQQQMASFWGNKFDQATSKAFSSASLIGLADRIFPLAMRPTLLAAMQQAVAAPMPHCMRSCDDGAGSEAADQRASVGDEATSEPLPDLGASPAGSASAPRQCSAEIGDAGSSFGEEAEDSFLDESGGAFRMLDNRAACGSSAGEAVSTASSALAPPSTDTPAAAAAAALRAGGSAARQQRQAGQQRRSLSVREGDRRTSRRPLNQLSADSVGLQPPQPQHQQQLSKARSISPAMMMRAASSGEEAADAEAKPKAEATTDEAVAESPMEAKAESAVELEDNCGSDEGRVGPGICSGGGSRGPLGEAAEIELNSSPATPRSRGGGGQRCPAGAAAVGGALPASRKLRTAAVPGSVREAQLLAAIEEGRRLRERLDAEDAALDKRLDALQRLLSARRNQIRRQVSGAGASSYSPVEVSPPRPAAARAKSTMAPPPPPPPKPPKPQLSAGDEKDLISRRLQQQQQQHS